MIGIVGSGSWGTALAKVLTDNGNPILWHFHNQEDMEVFQKNGVNAKYFSEATFNRQLTLVTNHIQELEQCEVILLACPSAYLQILLRPLPSNFFQNRLIVSAIKGFVGEDSLFVSEFLEKEYHILPEQFFVLSGPSHAEEVVQNKITYLQLGSKNFENSIAKLFENQFFRITMTRDVYGLQLAGVLKNVYAIASGIVNGMNYGDNLQAAIVTAAAKETQNIFSYLQYPVEDFLQFGYLGDLLVTAYSKHSRNRNFGFYLGQGYDKEKIFEILKTKPEGFFTLVKIQTRFPIHLFPILSFTDKFTFLKNRPEILLAELLSKLG